MKVWWCDKHTKFGSQCGSKSCLQEIWTPVAKISSLISFLAHQRGLKPQFEFNSLTLKSGYTLSTWRHADFQTISKFQQAKKVQNVLENVSGLFWRRLWNPLRKGSKGLLSNWGLIFEWIFIWFIYKVIPFPAWKPHNKSYIIWSLTLRGSAIRLSLPATWPCRIVSCSIQQNPTHARCCKFTIKLCPVSSMLWAGTRPWGEGGGKGFSLDLLQNCSIFVTKKSESIWIF